MKLEQLFNKLQTFRKLSSNKSKLFCLCSPIKNSAKKADEDGPSVVDEDFEESSSWVNVPIYLEKKYSLAQSAESMSIYDELSDSEDANEESLTDTYVLQRRHHHECLDATIRPLVKARASAKIKVPRINSKLKMISEQFVEERLSIDIPVSEFKQAQKSEVQKLM